MRLPEPRQALNFVKLVGEDKRREWVEGLGLEYFGFHIKLESIGKYEKARSVIRADLDRNRIW